MATNQLASALFPATEPRDPHVIGRRPHYRKNFLRIETVRDDAHRHVLHRWKFVSTGGMLYEGDGESITDCILLAQIYGYSGHVGEIETTSGDPMDYGWCPQCGSRWTEDGCESQCDRGERI